MSVDGRFFDVLSGRLQWQDDGKQKAGTLSQATDERFVFQVIRGISSLHPHAAQYGHDLQDTFGGRLLFRCHLDLYLYTREHLPFASEDQRRTGSCDVDVRELLRLCTERDRISTLTLGSNQRISTFRQFNAVIAQAGLVSCALDPASDVVNLLASAGQANGIRIVGDGERCHDTDDGYHDHQLNQRKRKDALSSVGSAAGWRHERHGCDCGDE